MMIIMPNDMKKAPRFEDHPTVRAVAGRAAPPAAQLTLEEVRRIALEAGADEAGAVSLDHPDLAEERPHALRAMPTTRSRSVEGFGTVAIGRIVDVPAHRITESMRGNP
jgi:hypothetical protein